MKKNILYILIRPILTILFKIFYRPKIKGVNNIPKSDGVILAGNHTNNLDCALLISSTKRQIHFLAKIELFKGFKKILFSNLGLIPVDRSKKNPEAIKASIEYLNSNEIIGIFPEGTINRTNDIILPFKKGAIKMAKETNKKIVPFVITGKYKIFKNDLQIEFLKPIKVNENIENENKRLENIIIDKLEVNHEDI